MGSAPGIFAVFAITDGSITDGKKAEVPVDCCDDSTFVGFCFIRDTEYKYLVFRISKSSTFTWRLDSHVRPSNTQHPTTPVLGTFSPPNQHVFLRPVLHSAVVMFSETAVVVSSITQHHVALQTRQQLAAVVRSHEWCWLAG